MDCIYENINQEYAVSEIAPVIAKEDLVVFVSLSYIFNFLLTGALVLCNMCVLWDR